AASLGRRAARRRAAASPRRLLPRRAGRRRARARAARPPPPGRLGPFRAAVGADRARSLPRALGRRTARRGRAQQPGVMSAPRRVVTFTSLWPSPGQPHHGSFVQERMLRAVEGQDDLELVVVSPVAQPPAFWPGTRARLRGAPEVETRDGIAVHRPRYFHLPGMSLRAQAGRVARAALPVVARLVEGRSAVVDAHYVYPDGVAAVRIARALGVPCIVTARGTDVNVIAAREVVAGQVREAMAQATRCFAVSDALRGRFAEVAGLDAARVEVLRNGVDLARFAPGDRAAARARLGLPADGRLVLGVGRLVAGKGFEHAARALHLLPEDVALVVVGDGPRRAAL